MHPLGRAVDSVAEASGFSGVVRVDRGDDVEMAKAYGLAHRGHEIPNTLDTQFAIASGTRYLAVLDGHGTKSSRDERFAYNNGGYVVLALIAERTSGVPFRELVRQRV